MRRVSRRLCVGALLLLSACQTPGGERPVAVANPHYKVGAPYEVDGRRYVPTVDRNYDQVGIASWYGDAFHGRLTANGEIFDKTRLSAAHKTLPMPILVSVENLENGRSVVLRLNDRGPFVDDRIIDLSHAAADALGFTAKGLARVRVRYVAEADLYALAAAPGEVAKGMRPAPAETLAAPVAAAPLPPVATVAPPPPAIFWVEIATAASITALDAVAASAGALGPLAIVSEGAGGVQSLRLGPYTGEAEAAAALRNAAAAGFAAARLLPQQD